MTGKPTISIVTPTLNQVQTLAASMDSVLDQDGAGTMFDLQYIVADGGSQDGSQSIIEARRDRLHHWQSEEDQGPYQAVNEGLNRATGEILGWLNGDDLLCPWALRTVASIFSSLPDCRWLTSSRPISLCSSGQIADVICRDGFSSEAFLQGAHHPDSPEAFGYIQQESTFFRRDLWQQIGGQIDVDYPLAGDFDLWLQMAAHAEIDCVQVPLGMFRYVAGQRSSDSGRYQEEARRSLLKHTGIDPAERARAARGWLPRLKKRLFGRCATEYEGSILEVIDPQEATPRWKRSRVTISK